jgi:hypothetical protein
LWLRDSLPEHIPSARIMTYGYDSAVAFSTSRSEVSDFAADLLWRLHCERTSDEASSRPLIFVCHSLGGVVLKQALVMASHRRDNYGTILDSTYGVVFMGTPHRGSRTAGLALPLSRIINTAFLGQGIRSDLLKALVISSTTLEGISRSSVTCLERLKIISFYEQKPLPPLPTLVSVSQCRF